MTLTVSHLTFAYPKAPPVLEDVSFTVPAGDFLSVLGANGAGKSTLFRCLLGGLEGYTGAISLDGRDVRTFSRRELAARIAYIPQIHRPTFGYSVLDTALMGLTRHLSPFQSPSKALEQQALTALEQLGVAHLAQRNFAALSGGEQQLVLIARALCQQSELLIMDEPTASLDYGNQLRVLEQVRFLSGAGLHRPALHPRSPARPAFFPPRPGPARGPRGGGGRYPERADAGPDPAALWCGVRAAGYARRRGPAAGAGR